MTNDIAIKLEREFNAPVKEVFEAWTNPEQLKQWMGPGEVKCISAEVDFKVGGKYRIHMVSPEGDHVAFGEYQTIEPNKQLKFTWGWESGSVTGTIVTVHFEDLGGRTKVILLHENFQENDAAEKHNQGWNGCLDKLDSFVS